MTAHSLTYANWSVMWVAKGRIIEKKCGTDLQEALRIYGLATKGEKRALTLRCCNIGHSPPKKITRHPEHYVETVKVRRGKHKGERVKVKRVRYVNLMERYNNEGIFWCPYCMKLRRFNTVTKLKIDGIEWTPSRKEVLLQCPMCQITTKDFHVRQHNPKAIVLSYHRRVRVSRKKEKNGRRKRSRKR